jgi:Tol biopolymer transport system component
MTEPHAPLPDDAPRLPRRRQRRVAFWPALTALLFGGIVLILLVRQPWRPPPVQPAAQDEPAPAVIAATAGPQVPGRAIAYMRTTAADWDVFLRAADGTVTDLTPDADAPAFDGFPAFSADGGALLFLSTRGGPLAPYLLTLETGETAPFDGTLDAVVALLGAGRTDWDVRESADGAGVFASVRDLNWEIYLRERGETGLRETNLSLSPAADLYPARGPAGADGVRPVAFTSERDGNREIYLAGGGAVVRITDHPADDVAPAWLNDGRLLFVRLGEGAAPALYTVAADGYTVAADGYTVAAAGTALPAVSPYAPAPGPMGLPIAAASTWPGLGSLYMEWQPGSGAAGHWHIAFAPLSGEAPVLLTDGAADAWFPVWQP